MTGAPPEWNEGPASSTGLQPRVAAALAYLAGPFSGILVLLAEETSPYVKFHAWQSVIGLGGLGVVVVAIMTLAFVSIVVSATAFKVLLYLGLAIWAAWIVLLIVCLVQAFNGSAWRLPIVGEIAGRRAKA